MQLAFVSQPVYKQSLQYQFVLLLQHLKSLKLLTGQWTFEPKSKVKNPKWYNIMIKYRSNYLGYVGLPVALAAFYKKILEKQC